MTWADLIADLDLRRLCELCGERPPSATLRRGKEPELRICQGCGFRLMSFKVRT